METSKIPTTVRKVRGTNSTKNPRMVRKIHHTNRPWYETSTGERLQ